MDLYVLGSVCEEVDSTGAVTAAYGVVPDLCAAVDVTHGDSPDAPQGKDLPSGQGARHRRGPNCTRWMEQRMRRKAEELGMAVQTEVMAGHPAPTAGPSQVSREGVATAVLSLPLRYMHTPIEVISRRDLEDLARLLAAFVEGSERRRSPDEGAAEDPVRPERRVGGRGPGAGVPGGTGQALGPVYEGGPPGQPDRVEEGARAAGDRLMLCAHMDEVGLIVTHVTEEGFLKFDFVGGVDRRVAIGKPVVLGPDRVPGVVGIKAIHLVSRDEEKKVPKTDAFYLDIGARDREEALSRVEPGTYGSFVCTPEEFGEGLFKAKAVDDRVGCAVLLKLLEEDLPMDVVFVFTAQEEVGTRGAFGAAFSVAPETALVLETTTAADLPGVEGHRRVCAPGRAL